MYVFFLGKHFISSDTLEMTGKFDSSRREFKVETSDAGVRIG